METDKENVRSKKFSGTKRLEVILAEPIDELINNIKAIESKIAKEISKEQELKAVKLLFIDFPR